MYRAGDGSCPSGLCQIMSFGISDVEPSGSAIRDLAIKYGRY
jgi:hypothetical protein